MINPRLSARLITALFFAFSIVLVGCKPSEQQQNFIGYVEADLLYVAAAQSGWISKHHLEAGAQISKGDVLFQLDDEQQQALVKEASSRLQEAEAQERDAIAGARSEEIAAIEAQMMEAKAALDYAKSEQVRWTKLVIQGLAPASRRNQVNADYDASLARFKTIEANMQVAKLGARKEFIKSADAARQAAQAALTQAQWQLNQRTVTARIGTT
jgi:HlyD family secretion protein